jgi:hypothetical protein
MVDRGSVQDHLDVWPSFKSPAMSPMAEMLHGWLRFDLVARSRPETALFGNFVVRPRIPLCGVLEYASAEILVFLELAQKSLVSASRTAQFPPELLDGN